MTFDDQQIFDNSLNCSICQKKFWGLLGLDLIVISQVALEVQPTLNVTWIFHNFSKYDCHLFIQELGKIPGEISVIPINKENYISVSIKMKCLSENSFEIRFLDTYTLASNLVDDQ